MNGSSPKQSQVTNPANKQASVAAHAVGYFAKATGLSPDPSYMPQLTLLIEKRSAPVVKDCMDAVDSYNLTDTYAKVVDLASFCKHMERVRIFVEQQKASAKRPQYA